MSSEIITGLSLVAERLRTKYKPESFLKDYFSDNNFIFEYLCDPLAARNWPVEKSLKLNFMNPNIQGMDPRIDGELSIIDKNYLEPQHFTNSIVQKMLFDLDLTPTKEDMQIIRDSNLKVGSIGYGGAMVNLFHNLTLWSIHLSEVNMFDKLLFIDGDNMGLSNIFRMMKPMASKIVKSEEGTQSELSGIKKVFTAGQEEILSKTFMPMFLTEFIDQGNIGAFNGKGYVLIGAPTLEARKLIQEKNLDFYFFGHGGTGTALVYQPIVDETFSVEGYGVIDIPILAINFHISTCMLIKHLARQKPHGEGMVSGEDIGRFDAVDYITAHPEVLENFSQNIFEDPTYVDWNQKFKEKINSEGWEGTFPGAA